MEDYGNNIFVSTIHDSILTTRSNIGIVSEVMSEEFLEFDLSPEIRIES